MESRDHKNIFGRVLGRRSKVHIALMLSVMQNFRLGGYVAGRVLNDD
jgi:hypothetical protein